MITANKIGTLFLRGEFLKCSVIKPTFPFQSNNLSIPDCKKVTIRKKVLALLLDDWIVVSLCCFLRFL